MPHASYRKHDKAFGFQNDCSGKRLGHKCKAYAGIFPKREDFSVFYAVILQKMESGILLQTIKGERTQ